MSSAVHIYHPMIARAVTAYRRSENFGDSISRQLASMIGALPSTEAREAELRSIYVAVQFTALPKKFSPALHELSLQIVRLLGGIAQLRAIASLKQL
jgi:hypothetical protein